MMSIHRVKAFVFMLPVGIFLAFVCIKVFYTEFYTALIQEDSAIETLQAVCYFIAAIVACHASWLFFRGGMRVNGILYAFLAVALFFIAAEEISWGQRIFHLQTPEYFVNNNSQHEITIHNLKIIQYRLHLLYMLVGAYGAFAGLVASRYFAKWKNDRRHFVNFIAPDWYITPYFIFVFLIYTLLRYISIPYPGGFLVWRDQEPVELLLSMGFLLFVISGYLRLRQYQSCRVAPCSTTRRLPRSLLPTESHIH